MSNFVVSARKYRPMRFDDVVGQAHISNTLKNALQSEHIAHAYLFCGPRGVGKTTCARILAKILNCQNRTSDFEACNECASCKAFNENASFNVVELDAASNNSVEHIRALIEQVRFQPQQGKYKIFIIDEVHMLSTQAFNAFLKTLEEPPSYAIFILATTEKHKIIPTILSRCQIYDFRRIQIMDMVEHLHSICDKEGITADDNALHIIAQKADGALRDALSIFDRVTSFSGKQITYEEVISNLNVLDYDYYFRLVDAMQMEDLSSVILLFNEILKKGFDAELFIGGLSEHLRNILVCKDPQTLQLLEVGENLKDRYQNQSNNICTMFLLTALNICNDCDQNYKMARNKGIHVEVALMKMTYIHRAMIPPAAQQPAEIVPPAQKKSPNPNETVSIVASPTAEYVPHKIATGKNVTDEPPKPKASTKYAMPKVSLEILEQSATQEQRQQPTEITPIRYEALLKVIEQYEAQTTDNIVKNALEKAEVTLQNGKEITLTVGTAYAEGLLQPQKSNILSFLRATLKHPNLLLMIKVDTSKAPITPAPINKPFTAKEKYGKIVEINPLVEELRLRFDLKPDND